MIYSPREISPDKSEQDKNYSLLHAVKYRLEDIRPVLLKYGVKKLVAFGSVVKGTSKGNSDIDILVIPQLSGFMESNDSTVLRVIQKAIQDYFDLEVKELPDKGNRYVHLTFSSKENPSFLTGPTETIFDSTDIPEREVRYRESDDILEEIPSREEIMNEFNRSFLILQDKYGDLVESIVLFGESIRDGNRHFNLDSKIEYRIVYDSSKLSEGNKLLESLLQDFYDSLPTRLQRFVSDRMLYMGAIAREELGTMITNIGISDGYTILDGKESESVS